MLKQIWEERSTILLLGLILLIAVISWRAMVNDANKSSVHDDIRRYRSESAQSLADEYQWRQESGY
jgi:hypothetical protein